MYCIYTYICESIKQSPKLMLSLLSSKPGLLGDFGANDFDLAPSAIKSGA